MLTVACLRWGDKYGPEYVIRLQAGVARNLSLPYRFVCFTDDPIDGVECRPMPEPLETWWGKLSLFKSGVLSGRVLFLDLDTVIVGSLDDIAAYDGPFAALRDFYRPFGLCSGVMAWEGCADIWAKWGECHHPRLAGGDQAWIELMRPYADRLQDWFPGQIVSFKAHCQNGLPKNARVVAFHGRPNPHEVNEDWIARRWRGKE